MGEGGKAVEEARCRHGQTHARLPGEVARDRSGIAGVLLMAEREHADARGLRHAAEIGDRNARHAVDRVDVVELQRIDDEVKAVRQILLGFRRSRRGFFLYSCISHGFLL
jgi:hypothetical protein